MFFASPFHMWEVVDVGKPIQIGLVVAKPTATRIIPQDVYDALHMLER
jgi:hypothetical protein